ncbi:MAG: polynucleotide kinase-phosphatase [Chloroflexota bacterium]
MKITLPEFSFVVLIGASGSGKSTFAHTHFKPTEVVSSDVCRGLVSDDENDQTVTAEAFEVLHFIAGQRLAKMRLTVVDATNVQFEARRPLLQLAKKHHCLPVAIVFNLPEKICQARNAERPDRDFGPHVVRQHRQQLRRSLKRLKKEGFRYVYVLDSPDMVDAVTIERQPLWTNKRTESGPFDIIGDVHGCFDELVTLLQKLDYQISVQDDHPYRYDVTPPASRKAVFVGDLVDRGPKSPEVLRLVMGMVEAGQAICVPGNHDDKLRRYLAGRKVKIAHGLAETIAQLEAESPEFSQQVSAFIKSLVSHYVLDQGRLVVAHAGMRERYQGRASGRIRDFALYGDTTGEIDEFGLPVRLNWAAEYRGQAMVVYGHTPIPEPEWLNHTLNIDTGCVFGGKLTALRYPEKEWVSVPAAKEYAKPKRPLYPPTPSGLTAQQNVDDLLNIADVTGKRIVSTRLRQKITIREENGAAALEVMSRFAINPKWLIYLPPTMSPSETSKQADLLEHPAEAFAYFQREGITQVICQEKHMGSRAIVILCRNEAAAQQRFGVADEGIGVCYTRTGRRFFDNPALEAEFLTRLQTTFTQANFWEEHQTDWVCLDCELMPWSAKAQVLLEQQYAPAGAAAQASLSEIVPLLTQAVQHQTDATMTQELLQQYQQKATAVDQYRTAYRHYCWPVTQLTDLKLAPFHILAIENKVLIDHNHQWHMDALAKLCQVDATQNGESLLQATQYRLADLTDETSQAEGVIWWETMTKAGGEGMVVKQLDFVSHGANGLTQPAIKCRGPEYLRIIYGPEYTESANLKRLRQRGLSHKRSMALREFALGIEALERFVQKAPLRRVHECVFGVLALESEPVDPRL